MRVKILIFIISFMMFGCATNQAKMSKQDVILNNVKNATDQVTLDMTKMYIEKAYLWRNFQPIVPKGGRAMKASIRIKTVDGIIVPPTVKVKEVWFVYNDKAWKSVNIKEKRRFENILDIVVYDGAKLQTGIKVDVVVVLTDKFGNLAYLKKKSQTIRKVW